MLNKFFSLSVMGVFCFSLTAGQDLRAAEKRASQPSSKAGNSSLASLEEARNKLDFIPEVVAVVGEKPISGNQVKTVLLSDLASRIRSDFPLPEKEKLREIVYQTTHRLIDQELLFKNCREAGYDPTLREVEKKMKNLENRLGEERFANILQQQKLNRNEFMEQTANTLAFNQWMEKEVFPRINIDNGELENFYENNRDRIVEPEKVEVSHILLSVSDWADRGITQEVEKQAERLARQLDGNEDIFSEMAEEHSDCPSGQQGGRLPPFTRGEMVPEFEKAAFNTEPGVIKGPARTAYGFHLILVHEHHPEQQMSYKGARDELQQLLKQRRVNQEIKKVIEKQREETATEILFEP